MGTQDQGALKKLSRMKEDLLTKNVIVPLFKALGYSRVEYHHGPGEEGKDLVCWKLSEVGDQELAVVQIKRYKPSRRAADAKSFSEIVTQLSQASEKALPNLDGLEYCPEKIYLITPFEIDTATLKSRFEGMSLLRNRRIRILDGVHLLSLVKEKLPEVHSSLLGLQAQVSARFPSHLTNESLLNALEKPEQRSVGSFFTDIDFAMGGRPSTEIFFRAQLSGKSLGVAATRDDWANLESLDEISIHEFGCAIISDSEAGSRSKIRQQFNEDAVRFEKWRKAKERLQEERESKKISTHTLEGNIKKLENREQELANKILDDPRQQSAKRNLKRVQQSLLGERTKYSLALKELEEHDKEIDAHQLAEPNLVLDIKLDGKALAKSFEDRRQRLERQISHLNETGVKPQELMEFMIECEKALGPVGALISRPEIRRILGLKERSTPFFEEGNIMPLRSAGTRLQTSVLRTLEVGRCVTLLGGAGAGKTTALQMYAHNLLKSEGGGQDRDVCTISSPD